MDELPIRPWKNDPEEDALSFINLPKGWLRLEARRGPNRAATDLNG
jgi:hypothetical protein